MNRKRFVKVIYVLWMAIFMLIPAVLQAAGSISITAPAGGAALKGGSTYTIKWTSSDVDIVRIRFSSDGGSNYESAFATVNASDGQCAWEVPNINASNCVIKILANNAEGSPFAVSGVFSITQSSGNSIQVLSPKEGDKYGTNSTHVIRWESSTKYDYVELENVEGTTAYSITTHAPDTGYYIWTAPNRTSSDSRIWIKGYSADGNATDFSGTYTVESTPGTLTITSPIGGEVWGLNTKHNITWTSSGTIGTVNIYYSINAGADWDTIATSVANSGSYEWTVPSNKKSEKVLLRVSSADNLLITDISKKLLSLGGSKEIVLNKTKMNFASIINGATSCPQTVFVKSNGTSSLNWTAVSNSNFIKVSPASGDSDGYITVTMDTTGLGAGSYTGKITITDVNAANSPKEVTVTLTVKNTDEYPFGDYATPATGSTVSGSIAITGWALDDVCMDSVKIYRQINTNGDLAYIGDALFVEGARPDVELAYPSNPGNTKAGWGYMMLTNTLPDGQYVIKAIAKDNTGKETVLGSKTITIDNAHSKLPFGALDAPAPGGTASGKNYRNYGWALTPQPNTIPTNGSTIYVYIDGLFIGKANYNIYRADIAGIFPNYQNSNGAFAYLDFDTSYFSNGLHTINWNVTDNAGNIDGIGSRYFNILNTPYTSFGVNDTPIASTPLSILQTLPNSTGYIDVQTGLSTDSAFERVYTDNAGILHVSMTELQRMQANIDETTNEIAHAKRDQSELTAVETPNAANTESKVFHSGYMLVGDELRSLPAGAAINPRTGVFTWQPGPGFIGEYDIVLFTDRDGVAERKQIHVTINPKTSDKAVQE